MASPNRLAQDSQVQSSSLDLRSKGRAATARQDSSKTPKTERMFRRPTNSQPMDSRSRSGFSSSELINAHQFATPTTRATPRPRKYGNQGPNKGGVTPGPESLHYESDSDAGSIYLSPSSPTAVQLPFSSYLTQATGVTARSDDADTPEFLAGPNISCTGVSTTDNTPFLAPSASRQMSSSPLWNGNGGYPWEFTSPHSLTGPYPKPLCDDSGYSSLSFSELNLENEAVKDVPVKAESPSTPDSIGWSPASKMIQRSAQTQDSGLVLASGKRNARTRKSQSPNRGLPEPQTVSKSGVAGHGLVRINPLVHVLAQDPCLVEAGGPSRSFRTTNDPHMGTEILTGISGGDDLSEQVVAQGFQTRTTTMDTPVSNMIDNHNEDADSALDDGITSRSPSPWQAANSAETETLLAQTLWRVVNALNDIPSSHASINSSSGNSGAATPAMVSIDGTVARTTGSGPENSSSLPVTSLAGFATSADCPNLNKTRGLSDISRDADDGDGDENEPNRKRPRPPTTEPPLSRLKFACPYQKYDAIGSPFCCMPSNKNPEGGADTFSRIKSHVLRNHDPSVRCSNCWKFCKTQNEAEMHQITSDCIQKASPGKYWMTKEQGDQVRRRKFTATNTANWFCLFGILLPRVPTDGHNGYKNISPYYTPSLPGPRPPTPSSVGSWNRSISSGQTRSSGPTPPRPQQSAESLIGPQPLANSFQDAPNVDLDFSPFLNGLEADSTMDGILRWDDSNGAFSGPIDVPTQPQGSDSPPSKSILAPTTLGIPDIPVTQPDPVEPSIEFDRPANPSSDFLRQDNCRLRNNNDQLRDETEMLRRQVNEMHYGTQARFNELRDSLRSLERLLQELLYVPVIQNGEQGVTNRLFAILDMVVVMNKTLGSGPGAGRR